jgi:hypothetical protein
MDRLRRQNTAAKRSDGQANKYPQPLVVTRPVFHPVENNCIAKMKTGDDNLRYPFHSIAHRGHDPPFTQQSERWTSMVPNSVRHVIDLSSLKLGKIACRVHGTFVGSFSMSPAIGFVIPTGAKRSGGIWPRTSGMPGLWPDVSTALRSAQHDKSANPLWNMQDGWATGAVCFSFARTPHPKRPLDLGRGFGYTGAAKFF